MTLAMHVKPMSAYKGKFGQVAIGKQAVTQEITSDPVDISTVLVLHWPMTVQVLFESIIM